MVAFLSRPRGRAGGRLGRAARGIAWLAALCGIAAAPARGEDTAPADLALTGGVIHTGLADAPTAQALAARDGVIVYVGDEAGLAAWISQDTDVIALDGATAFPGFTDAHAHLLGVGLREMTLNLEGTPSLAALVARVAQEAADAGSDAAITGRGWIETHWPEARFPNRHDLDAVAPDAPVILQRADGHAAVVNTAALTAAGIDADTADPFGGQILREADGAPDGMLIDAAQELVAPLVGSVSDAQKQEAYVKAGEVYAALGWTGVHNMSVDPADVPVIERLAQEGRLPIRVYNSLDAAGADLVMDGPRMAEGGRIVTRALKLYIDGALGSRGAALLSPYADAPQTAGLVLLDQSAATPLLKQALRAGVQINTHAIGDRGNRLVLDWYEQMFAAVPAAERAVAQPRWRIEHAQIIAPADIPRFAALGIIPSMQPSHAIGDLHFAPARLGMARLDGAYAWRSLLDAGAIIAGGSDAPVERGDPRIEFYAAVARRDLSGFSGEGWRPQEAVSRAEALAMFTAWPAYASFQEETLGVLAPGMQADVSVFAGDLMTVEPGAIPATAVVMTIVAGDVVFRSAL